jgi:hypothetical protein
VGLGQAMGYQYIRLVAGRLSERRAPGSMLIQPSQHGERQPDAIQLDPVLDYQSRLDPRPLRFVRHLTSMPWCVAFCTPGDER